MKKIAVIPARGGSKRLPRKNIINFLGRPILHYSIEAARQSGLFDTILVTTEDEEIRHCAEQTGCRTIKRPDHLANDTATVDETLLNLLAGLRQQGETYSWLCCIYATAPMLQGNDLVESFKLLMKKKADFCMGVTEFETSPFFAFDILADGRLRRRFPEILRLPPASRPALLVDNGSFYWGRIEKFMTLGTLEGENTVGYFMERERSVDIDTLSDLRLAEYFTGKKQN